LDLITAVVSIVAGSSWLIRNELAGRLNDLSEAYRRSFAKALYDQGRNVNAPLALEQETGNDFTVKNNA